MDNMYLPSPYRIIDRQNHTGDTALFRVACSMNPEPGQFVEVSVMGAGECPISVCSHNPGHIDLLVRRMGNVTGKIMQLDRGDNMLIRGPYGKGYPMKDMAGKGIVVIAGGTGIAPPRSVLQYVESNRHMFHEIKLFVGFRSPEEILFKQEIEHWRKAFSLTLTVDQCADPSFSGRVCFVTEAFADAEISPEGTVAIICGPPVMMNAAAQKLQKQGFSDSQMYLSFERHMKCGVGKCGHCMVAGKYMCKDGPVFSYAQARGFYD